jgi:hypothetical protein
MSIKNELTKVKEIVLEELRTDERCRNDDKYLTWKVMRRFTPIWIPLKDFEKIPAFESIRRTRAFIQNEEKRFLPTDEKVRKARRVNEEAYREWLRNEKYKD